ncbi:type I methionyl aminopeptidase [Dictyobacter formicarum]|uniref:Methionine aminopeptidase n=1 Tax=Dictyobacter formicarum TaxID=2778368 RepID=A0ABQ3VWE5_9CHLR|nr:type I methionyl aminopeptidase [Dictyobacter formicarum]GHO89621.1 methionine aminopeptidase [Dictyobacter formicarum]
MQARKPNLKSEEEIALMRRAGLLTWQAHQVAAALIRPGVTTAEINAAMEAFMLEQQAEPLFKGVPDSTGRVPFPAVACISVNEQLVHGIPGPRQLQEGDIVSIDTGVRYQGWCGDAAVTHAVGEIKASTRRLLEVTEGALRLAIELIPEKQFWSEVARAMEAYVTQAGFTVVEGLVGHSIGREMWEMPQVPNYFSLQYQALGDFELQPGVVIAVEPMVSMSSRHVRMLPDHWTLVAEDGQPAAHFEHTLAITSAGVQILTAGPDGKAWALPDKHI